MANDSTAEPMEKREGDQLVGAVLTVGSTRHTIIRWDYRRTMFTTRNLFTQSEGEIAARTLEDAITEGIVTVRRKYNGKA